MAFTTIDDPSAYFHIQLYSGDGGGSNAITNDANAGDFKPDWLWIKERTSTSSNTLVDSTRGAGNILLSDNNNAEASAPAVSSLNTDGFTLGSDGKTNEVSQTYVAWQWKANGGTTSSNTDGSITSTVQANTTAGFSIVTWTGNGNTATIGHGLGATPQVVILKSRDNAHDWFVGHEKKHSTPWQKYLTLHTTNAVADDLIWNDTAPTSSVFSVGNYDSTNGNTVKFVAYCFAEKQGYSKFGSYTGNGSTDGAFIYTGFKPAWVMYKQTNAGTRDWIIVDNKRDSFNVCDSELYANSNSAEGTVDLLDFVSNGFKCRRSHNSQNGSGDSYIYLAFASSPFVSSEGVPTTAR